jgi:YaiO family outer membrane protein
MQKLRIVFFLSLFSLIRLSAQDTATRVTPEEEFARMRTLASDGDYRAAKQAGYKLLADHADYFDVALYLARIHGWESQFDSAYMLVDRVISGDPGLYEAYETCADLAYWENNLQRLDSCARGAAAIEPDSAGRFERYRMAIRQSLPRTPQKEFFTYYSYDHFSVPYHRNWHMLTAGMELPVEHGKLIPFINGGYFAGDASQKTDLQFNLDAYLTLGKKNYAMLGYGFSPSGGVNYFPGHRGAAELWQTLPGGYAVSAGLRYVYWDRNFFYLTASGEKYVGHYWFNLRTYIFFKDYGTSGSYYLSARRYFDSEFDHLTLTAGYGTSPDEPVLVISDLDRLSALSGRIAWLKTLSPRVRLNVMAGYAWEEYTPQEYRHRIDARIGAYFILER